MPRAAINPALATVITGTIGAPRSKLGGAQGLSVGEMKPEVLSGLGQRTDVDAARVMTWLNEAYQEMAGMLDLSELKSSLNFFTVPDQPFYLLPDNVWAVIAVQPNRNVTGPETDLSYDRVTDVETWRRLMDSTALPYPSIIRGKYFKWNQVLALWPTPSITDPFTVDFRFTPRPLTLDDDVPVFDVMWHSALIEKTLAIAHRRLREFDTAGLFDNNFLSIVRSNKSKDAADLRGQVGTLSFPRSWRDLNRRLPLGGDLDDTNES